MSVAPIDVWAHWGAPNPWKVCMVLEVLEVPYNLHFLEFSEVKQDSYLALTPNGRLPTIKDPNTGLTLWESGAIIQYLVDLYDTSGKISYSTLQGRYQTQQWLAFQISGQGPYYGQATWFARFHPDKLPSATERYVNEVIRVIGVLDLGLERNGTGWVVGEKCTYADLSFRTWASVGEGLLRELGKFEGITEKYPKYTEWLKKMDEIDGVKKVQALMAKGRAEHGLK
ncbi:glutathione S-transferase [Setomelanomma holmii]|uniref:Glutathione S-transferase n=1 Tax=Setomelanomma holmii TaxID=210430 RepID=A0A9P4H7W7_9PLEO|nr:glutathione S-transferase [Setomelanomma holmii]